MGGEGNIVASARIIYSSKDSTVCYKAIPNHEVPTIDKHNSAPYLSLVLYLSYNGHLALYTKCLLVDNLFTGDGIVGSA